MKLKQMESKSNKRRFNETTEKEILEQIIADPLQVDQRGSERAETCKGAPKQ